MNAALSPARVLRSRARLFHPRTSALRLHATANPGIELPNRLASHFQKCHIVVVGMLCPSPMHALARSYLLPFEPLSRREGPTARILTASQCGHESPRTPRTLRCPPPAQIGVHAAPQSKLNGSHIVDV